MKKLLIIALAISAFACKEEAPKDYVTLSGKITNKTGDSIFIKSRNYSKTIALNEDGSFSDTLKVTPGVYSFFDGNEFTTLYLANGYDLNMTLDTEKFDETVKYTGEGADNSNFLADKGRVEEKALDIDKFTVLEDEAELDAALNAVKTELTEFYNSNPAVDSTLVAQANQSIDPLLKSYRSYFVQSIAVKKALPKGSPSPVFENYENYAGGTTSLEDLKGKYVYIDVWATWCGPCKVEIPFLKELEEQYKDKNIQFVSISVDNGRGYRAETPEAAWAASKEGWKKMIADKEMGGIQLFADNAFQSDFIQAYKINGIPRFLLIDPDGNIVSADAPRPSGEGIIKLFNELNI